jgi:two-component system sensor histidine kinase DesK
MSAPDDAPMMGRHMWSHGWQRYFFPGLWLVYVAQTIDGVHKHSHGAAAVAGYVIVGVFCVAYLLALPTAWTGERRKFRVIYASCYALTAIETLFAHQDAFVFCVYIAVLTVAGFKRHALPIVALMAVVIMFVPALVPSWHSGIDYTSGITVALVSLAMVGFFEIIRSNIELAEARAEVARLAAENERSRIARDLHDLLGHSLTTITVKAGLARRLAELGEMDRAAAEIASVETLSRRSLGDVRAAVSGYHDVTLAGELATSREVLRASGIGAELPGAVDGVPPDLNELFGWVVREGITNVVRHSHATQCTVAVGPSWIEITDNGRGGANAPGHGLIGLRQRVAEYGGVVEAAGCPAGWRLRVDVEGARAEETGPPEPAPIAHAAD